MRDTIMNGLKSLKMKPAAAIFMALALITTTFAGVSYADPSEDFSNSPNTYVGFDSIDLDLIVEFEGNQSTGNLTTILYIFDVDDEDNFNMSYGPITMVNNTDTSETFTHWAWQNMTTFFEGNDTIGPIATEGVWYGVMTSIYESGSSPVGVYYTEICMEDGVDCEDDGSNEVSVSMDYDELDIDIEYTASQGATNLTTYLYIFDSSWDFDITDEDNYTVYGPITMINNTDSSESYTHWAWQNMTHFFEGGETVDPIAIDGQWYGVQTYVYDDSNYVGDYYLEICMEEGNECHDDTSNQLQSVFSNMDSNDDGAVNASEMIAFINDDDGYEMNSTEEMEVIQELADYDIGFNDGMGSIEYANDSMLEINEFTNWFYNVWMITGADAYLSEDGELLVEFHDDFDIISTIQLTVNDMNGNTLINMTINEDEDGSFNQYTNSTCCTDNGLYIVTVVMFNEDGDPSFMSTYQLGEMPTFGEIMMQMYDQNGDNFASVSEIVNQTNTLSQQDGNPPMDERDIHMVTYFVITSDKNNDSLLDVDELVIYYNTMQEMNNNSDGNNYQMMLIMSDMNFDGYLNMSEILDTLNPATDQTPDAQMNTYWTNLFNENDGDGNSLLDAEEFQDLMEKHAEIAGDDCYPVSVGDVILGNGTFSSANGSDSNFMETGEIVTLNGTFCQWREMGPNGILYTIDTNGDRNASLSEIVAWMGINASDANHLQMIGWMFDTYDKNNDAMLNPNEFGDFVMWMNSDQEYIPTTEQIMSMWDLNQDGSVTLTEIIEHLNTMNMEEGEANLSDIEIEYFGILFKMSDSNSNQLLNVDEFAKFYEQLNDRNQDDDNHMGQEDDRNGTDHHHGHGDHDDRDDGDFSFEFSHIDVWFEQWNNQQMELVVVELAVFDSPEEIGRLVRMADSMYGNNDSVVDAAEADMLMGMFALSMNPQEMAEGLTLDNANGTAVDFWVEIDGLIEGDDIVFIRTGTVIAFPTTPYANSTTHTFVVENGRDQDRTDHGNASEEMRSSARSDDNCDERSIWIHNSNTWNVASATGFSYEETNNAWYAEDCDLVDINPVTFTLSKVENGTLPAPESDDWTWEDEEMNLLPVCKWHYTVTFANGTMIEDNWMGDAPTSGDYMIMLVDDAAYQIFVSCWDPEGGMMTVDVSSELGNSSNTSIGEAMGFVSFKLPPGTGGNFTFDVSWTDGYYTEDSTITVVAAGVGTIDLSEVEVDEVEAEGLLPGFTVGLGVVSMLGAAMLAGRREQA